jgi:hypothetical protein
MTMGPVPDGLPFQLVMLFSSFPLGVITYNFSLTIIFFCLVPMSKITKSNHLQINNLKIIINLLTSQKKLTANCSRNYDTHIISHTYDILYSITYNYLNPLLGISCSVGMHTCCYWAVLPDPLSEHTLSSLWNYCILQKEKFIEEICTKIKPSFVSV